MSSFLFTGLAFACAGGVCALAGDLQRRMYLGLACFLAINAVIWIRFVHALFAADDLLLATGLFLISHLSATCAYLGMIYFLGGKEQASSDCMLARE